jgi:hypothetical protein
MLVELTTMFFGFGLLGAVAFNIYSHHPETLLQQFELLIP